MALTTRTRKRLKRAAVAVIASLTLAIIILGVWLYRLDQQIADRLAKGRFAPAVEFLAAPEIIRPGFALPPRHLESFFERMGYADRGFDRERRLEPGEYSVWTGAQCRDVIGPIQSAAAATDAAAVEADPAAEPVPWPPRNAPEGDAPVPVAETSKCVAYVTARPLPAAQIIGGETVQIAALGADGMSVIATFAGAPPRPTREIALEPELFAQYYGDRPILRQEIGIGEVPASCLFAVVSVEDANFEDHAGISVRGIARAVIAALRDGRARQGGSTITQQLVKNYFLTDERTLRRKITEIGMAPLLERRLAQDSEGRAFKDRILELYLNTIYMGQNGVFEVRGFAAAARHYFGKELRDLDLPQCALLAGVLNGPGVFNPFSKPEAATKRRQKVLDDMLKLGHISAAEHGGASATPLPKRPQQGLSEPAPYFVQTVRTRLKDIGIDEREGLRVYTTLNLRAQEAAYQAVRVGLERLEAGNKTVKALKEKGKHLESVLLASDPANGHVMALVGGRGFKKSPYNRAFESLRQIGSVMKPIVYLTALEKLDENGQPYTPLSLVKDEAMTHKYQGQRWSPRNYDGKFNGDVPMFWALKESLNAATAWLGLQVGLNDIIDIAQRLGVRSPINPVPSLTLGAFEMHPWEVLQAYGALARLGELAPITFMIRVEDLAGEPLYQHETEPEQVVADDAAAQLVSMMKETLGSGTARGARLAGFTAPAAGKTGTTNDKKDAWFAGFTPHHVAVVWVGYDDNTSHNLTGGSGAVPIWTSYMKAFGTTYPPADFNWPESTEVSLVGPDLQMSLGVPVKDGEGLAPVPLVFRKGQAPAHRSSEATNPSATPAPFPYKPGGN